MREEIAPSGGQKTPDFIIIGAQKCGTSTLFHRLAKHPDIHLPRRKELHFFDEQYAMGMDWYLHHFNKKVRPLPFYTGEASPYYFFHPLARMRIAESFPEIKLILLLRNPVTRAYSQYHHMLRKGRISLSFEHCIQLETDVLRERKEAFFQHENHSDLIYRRFSFLARSRYAEQLEGWYRYFSKEQILIIRSEDYFTTGEKILNEIFQFLDLFHFPFQIEKDHIKSAYPQMKSETREQLQAYFAPFNQQLYQLTGRDFGWK